MAADALALEFGDSPIAIERYDAEGNLVWANQKAREVLGMQSSLPKVNILTSEEVRAKVKDALGRGEAVCTNFAHSRHVSGTETREAVWYRLTAFPTFSGGSDPTGYWILYEDFTKRNFTERNLQPGDIRSILHNATLDSPVAALTFEKRIIYCNTPWAAIHGGDKQDFVGRIWVQVSPVDAGSELNQLTDEVMGSGFPQKCLRPYGDSTFEVDIRPMEFGAIHAARDVTEWLRVQEELRQLPAHLQDAREEEALKISHELHDDLGATLTAMTAALGALQMDVEESAVVEQLKAVRNMASAAIGEVRRIAQGLRPASLDQLGLLPALRELSQEFARRTGINCTLAAEEAEGVSLERLALPAYRVVQESLTNVERHAEGATWARIRVAVASDTLLVSVEDNGQGLMLAAPQHGETLGLRGMKERAQGVGGSLTVSLGECGGMLVSASMPLQSRAP